MTHAPLPWPQAPDLDLALQRALAPHRRSPGDDCGDSGEPRRVRVEPRMGDADGNAAVGVLRGVGLGAIVWVLIGWLVWRTIQ